VIEGTTPGVRASSASSHRQVRGLRPTSGRLCRLMSMRRAPWSAPATPGCQRR